MSEIARPVERVVIVGAGIAGLGAAAELTKAGISCVVLEARDRKPVVGAVRQARRGARRG